jgi:hypothetical protein
VTQVGAARKRPRWLLIAGVAPAVVLAVLIGLEHRYGPIDPTDPGWKANVVNDTGQAIHLGGLTIAPRRSDIVVAPGPGALHPTFKVTDTHGGTIGCLSVALDREKTVTVRASTIHACAGAR